MAADPFAGLLTAGQAAATNAAIAARQPVNPATLNDKVALTNALRAGQINQNQFANRYNQVYNKPVAAPYSVGNTASALGSALNKVFVQPVKAAGVDTFKATEGLGKQLLQAPATQQQRQSIITNQTKAATNPEFQKATVGLNPKNNSAQGYIQAQQMAARGAKANEIRTFLQQDAAKLNAQTQKGINALGVVAGIDVGAPGRVITSAKQAFIDGPKALIENSTRQRLLAAGEKANTPTKIPVEGGDTYPSQVPVKTPVRPGIRQESTTTKINVRTPNQMTDAQFTKEFNQLSKGYERDTKSLQNLPTSRAKALTNSLETHYQSKLNDLLDRYHNPELTPTKAPKTLSSSISKAEKTTGGLQSPLAQAVTRARSQPITRPSAFDKVEVPQSTELVGKTAPEASTKPTEAPAVTTPAPSAPKSDLVGTKPEPAPTKPQPTVPTQKVAGSSLRTQAEAVQAGMKAEGEATGATYDTVSHKAEAAKAVKLVQEDPQKAMDIAMGKTRGDNASHESAVYHAVKNVELAKAKQTGDYSTITELANAPRHTEVSEAAQKLSAEGYNTNPHDPLNIMHDIAQTRTKALGKGGTAKLAKETANITNEVKAATPRIKREDWHSFVDSLKC